jgi:hypothetical protein
LRIPYDTSACLGRDFIDLPQEVIAAILITVNEGWRHAWACDDVNVLSREIFTTERLRDGMRNALKSAKHSWSKTIKLVVLPGTESRSGTNVVVPDGRTDIPLLSIEIFLRTEVHDPHAIIECKRIAGSDTHLCREYVVEGVDRFRKGKYGQNHTVGFMVGYVLSGTAAQSAEGVNIYLKRASRNEDVLEPEEVCDTVRSWASRHTRAIPPPIYLYHVFLGVADVVT